MSRRPPPRSLALAARRSKIGDVDTVAQIETAILRRMTPAQKLAVMHALWRQAWNLKTAAVRRHHPEWTAEQVAARVREILRGAGS